MSCPFSDHQQDSCNDTPLGHGGARPKVTGHRNDYLRNDVSESRGTEFVDKKENSDKEKWGEFKHRKSQGCQKHLCKRRTGRFSEFHPPEHITENGILGFNNRIESDSEVDGFGVRGERTLSGKHGSPGNCLRNSKASRHEHHFSYPLLQWAFGGVSDTLHSDLFDHHIQHNRNGIHCSDISTAHHSACTKDPRHPNICKSKSLMLTNTPDVLTRKPAHPQVNHISLYDEADELLALERWRNAGLALRRVLTSKGVSRHRGGKQGESSEEGRDRGQISPECQNVVDEIVDDADDDTLKNVGSSSTCSTSESPEVFSMSETAPIQTSGSAQNHCMSLSMDKGGGIWDSQLYPTDMSGQIDLSPEQGEKEIENEVRESEESGLFPWRQGATLLGACLFPQCLGIIGGRSHFGIWGKGEGGDTCNDSRSTECNKDSLKLNCDMKYIDGNGAIRSQDSKPQTQESVSSSVCLREDKPNKVKQNRLSWNTEDEKFVLDSEDGVTLDEDRSGCVHQPGSQCTSSFHSEDSHGDATKSSGYHGDKGGESDVSDYSSVCDGSGDIYFYEDSEKFDTVPRRQKPRDKSTSPFKKTLQREKKKKLVHARKTHKRKSSSSSTDIMPEDCEADAQESLDVTEPFPSVSEPCPSFITCDAVGNYDQGEITPPRRSVSIARHFLDRGRSRGRPRAAGTNKPFRTRDSAASDFSRLPSFDISPLSRLPSFLESLQNSSGYSTPDQYENMGNSVTAEQDGKLEDIQENHGVTNFDKGGNSDDIHEKDAGSKLKGEDEGGRSIEKSSDGVDTNSGNPQQSSTDNKHTEDANKDAEGADNSSLIPNRGSNSLLSPDSWIRLIDEIYQPIVCESAGEESALSDTETEKAENKTPDFFRCLDTTDKSSDSGDADDEFECECDHCQLLRSLERPSRFLPSITTTADTGETTGDTGETTQRGEPWEADWAPNTDDTFDINLDDLRPLEPFLLSLQDLPQDPVDLMFQNVITQMLAVHPELLGEQAPPPVSQSVIDSLPALTASTDIIDDDLTCPVCLCRFELGEEMTRLPCHHRYHPLCIQAWLAKSGTCPVCRHSLHNCQGLDEEDF